jgi:hypothetical protein
MKQTKSGKIVVEVEVSCEVLRAFSEQSLFPTLDTFANFLIAEQMCTKKRQELGLPGDGRYALSPVAPASPETVVPEVELAVEDKPEDSESTESACLELEMVGS